MKCSAQAIGRLGFLYIWPRSVHGQKPVIVVQKKFSVTAYLVLMFSDVSIFFSIVNYVDKCGIFLVNCDLGLWFLPEEGDRLLPKSSVCVCVCVCWLFF